MVVPFDGSRKRLFAIGSPTRWSAALRAIRVMPMALNETFSAGVKPQKKRMGLRES
jgi:hypothetical protein